ncbi:STAS domain-containing protein [Paracoccus aerodenitrificans]|uniref:STAS domain-containing protein n=1 Tax=Paracoccus aerodenitrificans TaxID=3017781 RepID=UPI0022F13B75|nr:STAS domain-containing protein [Paracoccus aerodenitrificans]WBU63008.1 STAS domain-containing protein [Paracoccus aerodenitrificans]
MDVKIHDESGQIVICMAEKRLDAAIAGQFKDTVRPHVASEGGDLVLDLSAVEFLDSSGLGAVIALRKALPNGRRMYLRGLTANVDRVFRLTRMDQIFDIIPTDESGAA